MQMNQIRIPERRNCGEHIDVYRPRHLEHRDATGLPTARSAIRRNRPEFVIARPADRTEQENGHLDPGLDQSARQSRGRGSESAVNDRWKLGGQMEHAHLKLPRAALVPPSARGEGNGGASEYRY